MKFIKKLTSLLIVTVLVFVMPMHILAVDENNYQTDPSEVFACDVMSEIGSSVFAEYDEIYLSNAFSPYNYNTNELSSRKVYFIISNNDVIGELQVDYVNDEFSSNLIKDVDDFIKNNFYEDKEFGIGYYKDNTILKSEDTVIYNEDDVDADLIPIQKCYANKLIEFKPQTRFASSVHLDVPIVANQEHPMISDGGLCWAAALASVSNYWYGTSYNATGVWGLCWNSVGFNPGNIPVGNEEWILKATELLDITPLKEGYFPKYIDICGNLYGSNRPIFAAMKAIENGQYIAKHAILFSGYENGSIYITYYIIDSNCPDREIITTRGKNSDMSNGKEFYYISPSGVNYNGLSYWITFRAH